MSSATIRENVLSAVGWSAGNRIFGQLLNWAMTLFVVRFLRPDDYGLMGLATVATGFLMSLSYFGISDAVVQSKSIDEEGLRSVFGFVILINSALLVLLCAVAGPVADFYGDPRLIPLLRAASLVFVFITLQAIPNALLQKRLDLKRISRIEMAANVVAGLAGLTLAWAGFGVWSLMISMLTTTGLRAVGLCWIEPFWRTPSFRFRGHLHVLQNGLIRTAENTLWYLYNSSDILLIGKLLGPIPLGIYTVARQIAAIPAQKIVTVVKPTALPAFALVQHDRAEALRYLSKATRLIALISFPVFFGISAIAPQIVEIFLGPRWASVTLPLRLLALSMTLNSVGAILSSYLTGIGQFQASFRNTVFGMILFPVAYVIGSRWGVEGVCWAAALAYPVQFLVLARRCAISTKADIWTFLQPLARPLFGAAVMFCSLLWAQALLHSEPLGLVATFLISLGVTIYGGFCLIFCRPTIRELVSLARR
jgi:O-antigen/teichoic acid export membrane protein